MTETPEPDQASSHSTYRLKVSAGPSYSPSTHKTVHVNSPQTLTFESDHIIISLTVRIRHFTGFPPDAPESSPYFSHPLHTSDQYSISFSFIPKTDISGDDLVFGNDFDRPIRDRLPPGFGQAMKIVKWWIDPGLDGDVYSDTPYLYGPALSSWNILRIGDKIIPDVAAMEKDKSQKWKIPNAESFHETVVEEGADESGHDVRSELKIPNDSAGRKKFFLTESNRKEFTFEAGRLYQSDFGNPYLDFNDFSLKLPGFSLNIIKYIDSRTHELRYTLKNRNTQEVYCVVLFTLLFGEELEEEEKDWDMTQDGKAGDGGADKKVSAKEQDAPAPVSDDDDVD